MGSATHAYETYIVCQIIGLLSILYTLFLSSSALTTTETQRKICAYLALSLLLASSYISVITKYTNLAYKGFTFVLHSLELFLI